MKFKLIYLKKLNAKLYELNYFCSLYCIHNKPRRSELLLYLQFIERAKVHLNRTAHISAKIPCFIDSK